MQALVDAEGRHGPVASPPPRQSRRGDFRVLIAPQDESGLDNLTDPGHEAEALPRAIDLIRGTGPEDLSDRSIDAAVLIGGTDANRVQAWSRAAFPRPLLLVGPAPGCQGASDGLCALTWSGVYVVPDLAAALRRAAAAHRLRARYDFRLLENETDQRQYVALAAKVRTERVAGPLEGRTLPLGAFDRDGRLVACARLVRDLDGEPTEPRPEESPRAFADLEAFDGFRDRYRFVRDKGHEAGAIAGLFVEPEHRGRGLAREIVDGLIHLARQQGVAKLFLACPADMADLLAGSGFSAAPGLRLERGDEPPRIVMERCLLSGRDPIGEAP